MKRSFIIFLLGVLLLSPSCTKGKYPLTPDQMNPKPVENPEEKPEDKPEEKPEEKPEKPDFSKIKISGAFNETFTSTTSDFMELGYKVGAPDFRFYPNFPSFSERNARHLMLRVDPLDGEGMMSGVKISSKECTYHGTYSMRFCAPNIAKVQSDAGLIASLSVLADYDNFGTSEVAMEWKLADPTKVTLRLQFGSDKMETTVTPSASTTYSAAKSLTKYGFDWDEQNVTWWMMSGSTKVEIYKHTLGENQILGPGCCRFCYYYNGKKPKYPYELELDYISYEPAK